MDSVSSPGRAFGSLRFELGLRLRCRLRDLKIAETEDENTLFARRPRARSAPQPKIDVPIDADGVDDVAEAGGMVASDCVHGVGSMRVESDLTQSHGRTQTISSDAIQRIPSPAANASTHRRQQLYDDKLAQGRISEQEHLALVRSEGSLEAQKMMENHERNMQHESTATEMDIDGITAGALNPSTVSRTQQTAHKLRQRSSSAPDDYSGRDCGIMSPAMAAAAVV